MKKEQYFYRNVIFSKQGKTISIIDIDNPNNERTELEPWFAIVFQLADGQHTLDQLYQYMVLQYNGKVPETLSKTLHSVIQRLSENKFIILTEEPTELPYYLSMPYELLDIEKAKKIIKEDRSDLN